MTVFMNYLTECKTIDTFSLCISGGDFCDKVTSLYKSLESISHLFCSKTLIHSETSYI